MSCNECRDAVALVARLKLILAEIHEHVADLVDDHIEPGDESALWWDLCGLYEHTLHAAEEANDWVSHTVPIGTAEGMAIARRRARAAAEEASVAGPDEVDMGPVDE